MAIIIVELCYHVECMNRFNKINITRFELIELITNKISKLHVHGRNAEYRKNLHYSDT